MTVRLHRGDLPDLTRYSGAVAIDTETMGLHPHRDRLCVVQLSNGDGSVSQSGRLPRDLAARVARVTMKPATARAPLQGQTGALGKENGAQERTRTFTAVTPLAPEASASTNSATWARRGY